MGRPYVCLKSSRKMITLQIREGLDIKKLLDSALTLTSALVTSLVITAGVWVGESHSCWRLNEKHVWNCRINHKTITNQINMQSQHSTLAPYWFWVCMLGSTFQSYICRWPQLSRIPFQFHRHHRDRSNDRQRLPWWMRILPLFQELGFCWRWVPSGVG